MKVYFSARARHIRAIVKRIPEPIRGHLEEIILNLIFKRMLYDLKPKLILQGEPRGRKLAFCIVHWNAPDFLLLNVNQLEALHPESNIYILDNGSEPSNLDAIKEGLERFDNITLISARPKNSDHTIALQFLLNYSARQSDEIAVFLDQDCLLSNNVDSLTVNFNNDILLIGARDCVVIPKVYGPLKKGKLRNHPHAVHASFMMLQPKKILRLFGKYPFSQKKMKNAPWPFRQFYHVISYRAQRHIMFLETKMHDKIPILTSYSHQGVIYAWHAWYSSRTFKLSDQDSLKHKSSRKGGLPVPWLREVRKLAYEYMKQVHEAALTKRQIKKKIK